MAKLSYYKELAKEMSKYVKGIPDYELMRDYWSLISSSKKNLSMLDDITKKFEKSEITKQEFEEGKKFVFDISRNLKNWCEIQYRNTKDSKYSELQWDVFKFEAPYIFDSFLLYMDKKRKPEKRFYQPRRRTLKVVVQDLQDLEDGKLKFLGISLPPRVGKSTLCIFFMAWVIGRHKSSHNAMSGHSGILADRFYRDVMKLTDQNSEYTYSEIFPDVRLEDKSSDKNELFFDKKEAFATLTCRGIDGTWTGAVDISSDGYLYVDDMIRDRTESLSQQRLENRYQDYLNVLVDRKNDGSKELMVGTRWNVLDPLGRVESNNLHNPLYRFRRIPALDENDKSNFEYDYGLGFSTEYYLDMRNRLDNNEWMAKFQQKPFVREGLLLPEDELRTYNGVLPEGDHRVISACDIAWGGGDSLSMPIGYEYENGDVYIPSWIFNKGKKETTIPLVVGKIMSENITQLKFEGNNGGDMYCSYVQEKLDELGYRCSCSSKKAPNKMEKMAKMIAHSGYIIQHFVFLDEQHRKGEYKVAFDEMVMTTVDGKNIHDDAADGITQLSMGIEGNGVARVEAADNPMWNTRRYY